MILFADAIKVLCGSDKQMALGNADRRLNGYLVRLGLEEYFKFVTARNEYDDLSRLIDTIEFSICAGERRPPRASSA